MKAALLYAARFVGACLIVSVWYLFIIAGLYLAYSFLAALY